MRVYVETNFLLELVLEQEECAACETLIALAEEQKMELVAPAFCFVEPYGTLQRRAASREHLSQQLVRELRELGRTVTFSQEAATSVLPALLIQSAQHAEGRLEAATKRLLGAVAVLPLDHETITAATALRGTYALSRPDAIALASVLRDPQLGAVPSCFLNRNTRDFDDPAIVAEFTRRQCRMIGRFDHGLRYVQCALAASA